VLAVTGGSGTVGGIAYTVGVDGSGHQVIDFTGTATVAAYKAALEAVSFASAAENPSAVQRDITFQVNDGTNSSPLRRAFVDVTSINDAPVVDLNGAGTSVNYKTLYVENGAAVTISDSTVAISDPDNTILQSATIVLTDPALGDFLAAGAMPGTITASTYDPMTHSITLTGSASMADYQTAIAAITFASSSENPTGADRHVVVTVNDGNLNSAPATTTITVIPTKEPPTGADSIVALNEDMPIVITAANFGFSDPVDSPPDNFKDVIIDSLPTSGMLTNNGVPVVVGQVISIADIDAGLLVFTPAANANGSPYADFTFRVQDTGGTIATADVFSETFGVGNGRIDFAGAGLTGTTNYVYDSSGVVTDGNYVLTDSIAGTGDWWAQTTTFYPDLSFRDHTGDLNGRFMEVNASVAPGEFYRQTVTVSTADAYQVSVALANANALTIKPNVRIQILDSTNTVVATMDTGSLPDFTTSANAWQTYTLPANLPAGTYSFVLINNAPGGFGNDLFIDDIKFQRVFPTPGADTDPVANTMTFNVAPVNDTPVLDLNSAASVSDSNLGHTTSFTEGDAPVAVAMPVAGVTDIGEGDITSLTIVSAAISDGAAEVITIAGQPFPANADATHTAVVGSTTVSISYVSSTGTFTITNLAGAAVPMAPADLAALVQSVTYENTSQNPTAGDRTLSFTVTDSGNLTSAPAVATIQMIPVNDPPGLATPIPNQTTGDGSVVSILTVGTFSDPEGGVLIYSLASSAPSWLSIDPTTGEISGTAPADASQNSNSNIAGLYDVVVIATDAQGAQTPAQFRLTVTNLPPVAVADASAVGEDGPVLNGNVLTGAGNTVPGSGVDHDTAPDTDPLTVVSADQAGTAITLDVPFTTAGGGVLTLHADGSYSFDPGTAYNGLDQGTTATETISYTVSDGNGATSTTTLTLTINGANDPIVVIDPNNPGTPTNPTPAPDPLNIIPDPTTTDGAAITPIDVSSFMVDPEGKPISFTLDPATPSWLTIDPTTGQLTGTPPADASQNSNTGTPGEYLVTIIGTDSHGVLTTTTVTITVTNLPPVAEDDHATGGNEDHDQSGNVLADPMTGDYDTAPDADLLTVVGVAGGTVGQPIVLTYGTLTLDSHGAWIFTPNALANTLPMGALVQEVLSYTISDGNGGTGQATLTLDIHGVNDAPTSTPLPPATGFEGTPVSLPTAGVFHDVDTPDVLTFSATGLPPGLSIDPVTGLISGSPAVGSSAGGPYTVVVTADDHHGGTITSTFLLEVKVPAGNSPIPGPHVPGPGVPVEPPRNDIQPIVLPVVESMKDLHNATPVENDHIISRTVHQMSDTHALTDLDNRSDHITQLVEWLGRQGRTASWMNELFDMLEQTPYEGDGLVLALSGPQGKALGVHSVEWDGALFVGVDAIAPGAKVVSIMQANGKPLPSYALNLGQGDVVINVPVGQEWLELMITGRLPNGRIARWYVDLNLQTSEIITAHKPSEKTLSLFEASQLQMANSGTRAWVQTLSHLPST
ncbi:MAG: tandem-95 repeat protein, partial [Alphaproteobacteria bacterium]|nr:tandem-95 repeat protein [Alphaproteobacteria bacterium]